MAAPPDPVPTDSIAGSMAGSMIDYRGRVALVTGAASGIGRALALALAARGAHVLLADRNAPGLAQTAALIAELPGHAGSASRTADLAVPGAAAELVAWGYAACGRIDLICSNAGVSRNKRLAKEPLDAAVDTLFAVNFWAGLRLAQAFAAALQAAGQQGRIMFTGSENSLSVPQAVRGAGLGLYAASKHALLIMAEWLRDEMAGRALAVHVLLPGGVFTPLIADAIPDPALAPKELELIMPEQCAAIALRGLDLGLFYIPTQRHLAEDMRARSEGVAAALRSLGIA